MARSRYAGAMLLHAFAARAGAGEILAAAAGGDRGRARLLAAVSAHDGRAVCFVSGEPSGLSVTLPEALKELTGDHLEDLSSLRHAPIIVQQRVPKAFDVRATIIDGECFAGSVATARPESQLDWRMDVGAVWTGHELPVAVVDKLRVLMENLGLVYGAIDLRLRPDGEYVFFEVNPSGQYLFVETATGMPITERLADVLLHPPAHVMARAPSRQ
jgi:hypothetical protein